MLDIKTLNATIQWLASKQAETPSDGGKKKLIQSLIFEMQNKTTALEVATEAEGETIPTHDEILELVKDTKTQTVFKCKFCGVEQKIYKLYFSTIHAKIAAKIFKYCVKNKTHIFNKKDLDLNHTEY